MTGIRSRSAVLYIVRSEGSLPSTYPFAGKSWWGGWIFMPPISHFEASRSTSRFASFVRFGWTEPNGIKRLRSSRANSPTKRFTSSVKPITSGAT